MKLIISSVDTKHCDGEAKTLTLPGSEGELTVLSHHAPLITTLKQGTLRVKKEDDSVEEFAIESGILEVSENEATVLL